MVDDPDPMLPRWVEAGCEIVIVHAEATRHLHRTLSVIADLGARVGVALNPATPLEAVTNVLDLVDLLLVMTVNPGFGGQQYLAAMEYKIAAARAEIDRRGYEIELEVDGGIAGATIGAAARAGADVFCAGSALFNGPGTLEDRVAALRGVAASRNRVAMSIAPSATGSGELLTDEVDRLAITTLRFLAADAVQAANSGHPGLPLGAAPAAWVLWSRHLRHDPADPRWPDRDRFVLVGRSRFGAVVRVAACFRL